jgi:ribonuclease J
MTFIIHRGASEIGGSCVEVCSTSTRIVIDIGLPLMNPDGSSFDTSKINEMSTQDLIEEKILPGIPVLFGSTDDKNTALLISHAHQDHYGLINFVNKSIPVYLGQATHKLIELTSIFAGKDKTIENPHYFQSYIPFVFGDIEITAYLMDHAAFDAYAFLIRGEGKSLLYTGDFRSHGRKWKHFLKFLYVAPKNVDWLLMEGTSLSRNKQKHQTESQLETKFIKIFQETKGINLVYVSGQNIDRLVTIFRSCRRCGKLFVIDFYIATVLSELAALDYGVPFPSPNFPEVKVFFPNLLRKKMEKLGSNNLIEKFKDYEITPEEIDEKSKAIVMTIRQSMDYEIKRIHNLSGGTAIYSMWEGYKENQSTARFLENIVKRGAIITTIHTSGHADYYTLQKLISTINPLEVIPIHTLEGKNYKEYFNEANVKEVINGEVIGNENKQLHLLKTLEELGKKHDKSGLLPDNENEFNYFIENSRSYLEVICNKLNINEIQSILFADMINIFDGYEISIKKIAEYIGCRPIKLIDYLDDFEALENKHLIIINKNNEPEEWQNVLSFHISIKTLSDLQKNKVPTEDNLNKNIIKFTKK